MGEHKWLTVVSKEESNGAGIPLTAFHVDDVEKEYQRLLKLEVSFSMQSSVMGTAKIAVFNDTCGNNIQIF